MSIGIIIIAFAIPFILGFGTNTQEFYSLLTYLWVVSIAIVGGIVNLYRTAKQHRFRKIKFYEILGELFISGFCGVLTFWLCEFFEFNKFIEMFMVGVSGHLGTKCLDIFCIVFTQVIYNKIRMLFGLPPLENDEDIDTDKKN